MLSVQDMMSIKNKSKNNELDISVKQNIDPSFLKSFLTGQEEPDQRGLGLNSFLPDDGNSFLEDEIAGVNEQIAGIGSGSLAPVKNVSNSNLNDKLNASIQDTASKNLKYSQKRGKGCTDCSAFTQKVFKDTYGVNIGGWTEEQWKNGKSVKNSEAIPGDVVFFKSGKDKYKNRNVTHVGINNGDGTFTHFGTNGLQTRTPFKGYSLPMVGTRRYV